MAESLLVRPSQGYQIAHVPAPPKAIAPSEEIAARIDNRPLLELKEELDELASEVVGRATLETMESLFAC